jgi:hypothetical protein
MNWYGPGTGEYLVSCLEKMIDAVAAEKKEELRVQK